MWEGPGKPGLAVCVGCVTGAPTIPRYRASPSIIFSTPLTTRAKRS